MIACRAMLPCLQVLHFLLIGIYPHLVTIEQSRGDQHVNRVESKLKEGGWEKIMYAFKITRRTINKPELHLCNLPSHGPWELLESKESIPGTDNSKKRNVVSHPETI